MMLITNTMELCQNYRSIDSFDIDRQIIDFVSFHPIAVKTSMQGFLMDRWRNFDYLCVVYHCNVLPGMSKFWRLDNFKINLDMSDQFWILKNRISFMPSIVPLSFLCCVGRLFECLSPNFPNWAPRQSTPFRNLHMQFWLFGRPK